MIKFMSIIIKAKIDIIRPIFDQNKMNEELKIQRFIRMSTIILKIMRREYPI